MIEATHRRIFCMVDMDLKNHARLGESEINLKRDVENFDKKYVRPTNAIVIDSEIIPKGAELLLHHNATHDTYRIYDYKDLDGEYISGNEKHFSIPESECYAWRLSNGDWNPAPGFDFGLRIFKPYGGAIVGILPAQVKNKLYITSGEFKGKAVLTKGHCDYEITYQTSEGREGKLIRLRHFPNIPAHIREEIVAICPHTTNQIESGELLVGYSPSNAKQIRENVYT